MLTLGGSSGLRLPHELARPQRQTQQPGNATRPPAAPSGALFRSGALSIDRSMAFQVHSFLAQQPEHATPPRREVILAAYHAHLAARVRYYGPITPVDLRI